MCIGVAATIACVVCTGAAVALGQHKPLARVAALMLQLLVLETLEQRPPEQRLLWQGLLGLGPLVHSPIWPPFQTHIECGGPWWGAPTCHAATT